MKPLLSFIFILSYLNVIAQEQIKINPSVNIQTGYVSDKYFHFDFSFEANLKKDEQKFYPIAEVGGKFQLTEHKVAQVAGILVGGEYSTEKMFTSLSGGIGVSFTLPIIDRYKPNDSVTITISDGYVKGYFISPYASLKAGIYINGDNHIPIFLDLSYVGKLVWLGVGIKITF